MRGLRCVNATVTPYTPMPPPLLPWPGAAAEQRCKSRAGEGVRLSTGNVSAAGRAWQGTHFGWPPWPSAMCAAGPGATCWRAAPGLEIAAHSQPPPQQALRWLHASKCFWWRVFTCPAIPSHLIFIWEAQGVQESIHAPSLTVVLWWNEVCTVGHHQGSPKAI